MKIVFAVKSGPSENYHASPVPVLDMNILWFDSHYLSVEKLQHKEEKFFL